MSGYEVEEVAHAVPRSLFNTDGLPPQKAFALWQEQLDHIADARLAKGCDRFYARAEAVVLDKLVLGNVLNTTFTYDRSRFRIASDSVDHYMLQFYRKGRMVCRKTGAGDAIKPGDMMLADMANPELTTIDDIDVMYLVAPRAMLAPLLVEPESRGLRRFSGDNVLVRLLYEHVNALFSQSRHITMEEARALAPAVLEMSAAAINGAVTEQTERGVASSLTQAIQCYVRAHACDPRLSPEVIAGNFGLSPRRLSYMFKREGGIATYIQGERLRLARQALMDPAQRGKTIAEIAEAHGFSHRTSFIRAFERVYGLTPGQQRILTAERRNRHRDIPDPSPIKWIGNF